MMNSNSNDPKSEEDHHENVCDQQYKLNKFVKKEDCDRRSIRIAKNEKKTLEKDQKLFHLERLPTVVLQTITNHLQGVDAISYLLSMNGYYLCNDNKFATKFCQKEHMSIEIDFPFVFGQNDMYYWTTTHVCQYNSSRSYGRYSNPLFSRMKLNHMCSEYYSAAFETYIRLFPYNVYYGTDLMPLVDVFDYDVLDSSRALNKFELKLFKLSKYNNNHKEKSFINNFDAFVQNLSERFAYNEWRYTMNWLTFVVAGKIFIMIIVSKNAKTNSC